MADTVESFKDLIVWQKAIELSIQIHRATMEFPPEERYGLASELRKTARSVSYNIAEGHQRYTTREYVRFLDISLGSIAELETQIILSRRLAFVAEGDSKRLLSLTNEVGRMLRGLTRRLRPRTSH